MTIALYMDVHVHRAITVGLRLREVDVLTAQEDGYRTATDTRLLDQRQNLSVQSASSVHLFLPHHPEF